MTIIITAVQRIFLAIVDVIAMILRAFGLQLLQAYLLRQYRKSVTEKINKIIEKNFSKGNKRIANRVFWSGAARQAVTVICTSAVDGNGVEVKDAVEKQAVIFIDLANNIHLVDVEFLKLKVDIATNLDGELIPIPEGAISGVFGAAKSIAVKSNLQTIWIQLYGSEKSSADSPLFTLSYAVSMTEPFAKFGFCMSSTSKSRAQKVFDKILIKNYKKVDLPFVEIEPGIYAEDEVPYSVKNYNIREINKGYTNKAGKEVKGRTGKGVYVFVLDTGINDQTNPEKKDFIHRIDKNLSRNFTTPNEKDYQDRQGHGTHVSGTIASPVYGVAPDVTLVAVKVLNDNGSGTYDWITSAIKYVVDVKEKLNLKNVVINMSLGGPQPYALMEKAIEKAVAAGVIVCMAAGNSGDTQPDNDIGWPGKYAGKYDALCVAAIDEERIRAWFSSDGEELTIAAPGVKILSSDHKGDKVKYSGTSMATPFTVGSVALTLEEKELSAKELKEIVKEKADKVTEEKAERYYGSGIVNPKNYVEAVA